MFCFFHLELGRSQGDLSLPPPSLLIFSRLITFSDIISLSLRGREEASPPPLLVIKTSFPKIAAAHVRSLDPAVIPLGCSSLHHECSSILWLFTKFPRGP